MKALPALVRLHRWQLDERRRDVAELERLVADLQAQRSGLDTEMAAEQTIARAAGPGAFAYPGFAQGVIARRARLDASIAELNDRIAAARELLDVQFRELKRYEIAEDSRQRRARYAADRRAQTMLDEVGLEMHRRRAT
jgi:flagellar export protein FliJ